MPRPSAFEEEPPPPYSSAFIHVLEERGRLYPGDGRSPARRRQKCGGAGDRRIGRWGLVCGVVTGVAILALVIAFQVLAVWQSSINQDLQQDLDKLESRQAELSAGLQQELNQLNGRLAEQQAQLAVLQEQNRNFADNFRLMGTGLETLETELETLTAELVSLKAAGSQAVDGQQLLTDKLAQLQSQLHNLARTLDHSNLTTVAVPPAVMRRGGLEERLMLGAAVRSNNSLNSASALAASTAAVSLLATLCILGIPWGTG